MASQSLIRKMNALGISHEQLDLDKNENQFKDLIGRLQNEFIGKEELDLQQDWENNYGQFLKQIDCPYEGNNRSGVFDWCLSLALKNKRVQLREKPKDAEMEEADVIYDKLKEIDFHSQSFQNGVNQLAKLLHIPQHPNHLITLKAIAIFIQRDRNWASEQLKKMSDNEETFTNLDQIPLGFDTGNKDLNHAVLVLRLLFINDLRLLQTQINQLLVSVQSITAHPKTDTALGQVGK